jgi:hypothetical protein
VWVALDGKVEEIRDGFAGAIRGCLTGGDDAPQRAQHFGVEQLWRIR